MDLPVMPPVKPMLAKLGTLEEALALLDAGNGQLEPKWDLRRRSVPRGRRPLTSQREALS